MTLSRFDRCVGARHWEWLKIGLRRGLLAGLLSGATGIVSADAVRFAYSSNDLDHSLARYVINPDSGQLRFLDYLPLGKSSPEVVLDPSGQFLLALSQGINRVFVYRINHQTGELAAVAGSPFDIQGASPYQISFHPSGRYFYIALRFSGVGAYVFDPDTGAVTPLPGSPYPGEERTRGVVITADGGFLYAMNSYSNSISAFAVDAQTGGLRALPGSPFIVGNLGDIEYASFLSAEITSKAGGVPYGMLLASQGRFLLVSNMASANVNVFRRNSTTGLLSEVAGSPFFVGFNPTGIALHPEGRFVYVLRGRDSLIEVLELDPGTGRLTPMPGGTYESGGEGPMELVFHPQGQRAYVINWNSNDVAQLDVDTQTGALKVREVVKTRTTPWSLVLVKGEAPRVKSSLLIAALGSEGLAQNVGDVESAELKPQNVAGAVDAVAYDARQNLVYALDRAGASLTVLRRDVKGQMLPVPKGQVATGRAPSDVVIDRNGWYAYVTNADDNTMSVYFIDAESGQPRPVRGSPYKTGKQPTSISLDPAARYAYVVNSGDDSVSVYRYRSNVTPLVYESVGHGSPYATGKMPAAIQIDPTGRYAYVTNAGANTISAYRIHHLTGALSELPGSPFKAGQRPHAMAAHPNGRWLFVANHDSADISVFRIETALGALASAGSPLTLPFAARQLHWDPVAEVLVILAEKGRKLESYSVDDNTGLLTRVSRKSVKTSILDLLITTRE